jgi:SAM-dependent methyltransferase
VTILRRGWHYVLTILREVGAVSVPRIAPQKSAPGFPQVREGPPYSEEYFSERESTPTFALEIVATQRVLRERGVRSGRIVEVGAGSGALARACSGEAGMWIASDRDRTYLASVGRTAGLARRLVCDGRQMALAPRSCDAVVAQHVIEHFAEPDRVLMQWAEMLRDGGVCVLITPNRTFPNLHWFDDPTHQRLFTGDELAALMAEAGFGRIAVFRLVPWLGSEATIFLAARMQRWIPGALRLARDPSLSLLAVGSKTRT